MSVREYLAAYTFKEAFPEANILGLENFYWEKPRKKEKFKKTEHPQKIYSTKDGGLPKQP